VARPHVSRISELNPRLRAIHVVGEQHPGELAERGYVRRGEEWVLELRRPEAGGDADGVIREFEVLKRLGYEFPDGDEWSPSELFRKYRDQGRLNGEVR
jgi:hypothetical protein